MFSEISIEEALLLQLPVIDVRSPGEYEHGHIPQAVNIPLFSNDERAHVGTVYKQQSREAAIDVGYKYVTPKLNDFISRSFDVAPDGKVIVHCWRGGMRSQAFAKFLSENGFSDVKVIAGGYKFYRRLVLSDFAIPVQLNVLGGYTGSGKTYILNELKKSGKQVIDLEGLAHHKGSAFGGIGQAEQPTVEQFENNLHDKWRKLDLNDAVWVEDESYDIGRVKIPAPLFRQMTDGRLIFIEIPKEERAKHLVEEYGLCDSQALADAVLRISKRLGGLRVKNALNHLDERNFYEVAFIALHYYDKTYLKGMNRRNRERVIRISLPSTNHSENAVRIEKYLRIMDNIKLTQYSHGAGCGCKISPAVLSSILQTNQIAPNDARLLVGNDSRDDAAVYDMGNGTAIISTTDFFMPIVDDPFSFGKIAATNAISDVYAMGGKPLLAIAILGWPVDKIPAEVAQQVLEGGRQACKEAGISLAGGHSIDSPEPIFGLAVTGQVEISKLKRNDTATAGCKLYLTKPLGVGVFTTAQKQGKLLPEHQNIAPDSMSMLNKIGQVLADIDGIKAMTDVTGFGLLGHLTELCEGSKLSAEIEFDKIPVFPDVHQYITQGCMPGGTHRNWASYGQHIQLKADDNKFILCDPQTSGGLLLAVEASATDAVESLLKENNIEAVSFGQLYPQTETLIKVI
jgi:selenide, water dikinase